MKPSRVVKGKTKFVLQDLKCAGFSFARTDLKISGSGPVTSFNTMRPERWSLTVAPLFPNPVPVRLFAGPEAGVSVRWLPLQVSRSVHMERCVGDSSGKPHPAVTVGSQRRNTFRRVGIENGRGRVPVRIMATS